MSIITIDSLMKSNLEFHLSNRQITDEEFDMALDLYDTLNLENGSFAVEPAYATCGKRLVYFKSVQRWTFMQRRILYSVLIKTYKPHTLHDDGLVIFEFVKSHINITPDAYINYIALAFNRSERNEEQLTFILCYV